METTTSYGNRRDEDESSGKVRKIVLETNRRLKGDPVRKGNDPGKGTGNESRKGSCAKGRGAASDQGACSFQCRAPAKPTLILEPNKPWTGASDPGSEWSLALPTGAGSSLALRTGEQSSSVKKEREDRREDAAQPEHDDGARTSEAGQSSFNVDLEQE